MASMISSMQLAARPHTAPRRCSPRVVTVRSAASGGAFGNSYSPRPSWEELVEAQWARLGATGEFLRGKAAQAKRASPAHEQTLRTPSKRVEAPIAAQVFASDSTSDAIKKGGDKLEDAADNVADGIRGGKDDVKGAARDVKGDIKGAGRNARSEVDNAERDTKRAGNKLVDGFKDAADDLGDGIKNAGDRLTGRTEEDKAKDWLLQYKHVAFAHGVLRAATVVLLLSQLGGLSTAFASLIRWGEKLFGAAEVFTSAALSARAQLGLTAVTGALLATDYEAYRNHAWSDVKGKVVIELFYNAAAAVGGFLLIQSGKLSPGFGIFVALAVVFLAWNGYVYAKNT
ncbi:hypothetical protein WJX81_006322 [Elliptochloris bilobata]|uniref:Uncharacterized protein n=1 Tax=Elliptochloris bilobata TaxID=381761 RepID=A0AAW1QKN5_9CHLO